ncbi:MAG: ATP-dependent sacrificial sulfur transferase LarE [Verrucomicrobiales bacterium]|jgi:uncharacterized protein|nr:ATP-dependent sacrificial sulfur transferase LarE [Verrucomicrobiales bacterium]
MSDDKLPTLKKNLARHQRLCVCYSGGVDSAFLLKMAHDVLGERAFAMIVDSATLPRRELQSALTLAREIGADCHVIERDIFTIPELRQNVLKRCYYCKLSEFGLIKEQAVKLGATAVADGKNADDVKAHRPGIQAADELRVISPLFEAGLTKADIRRYSRELGLPTWEKPSHPCLSTRLPYNTEVTAELLKKIERAEEVLQKAGFREVRVRAHGDIARIEVPRENFTALTVTPRCVEELKRIGFRYITLDLEGFRSGSMDE